MQNTQSNSHVVLNSDSRQHEKSKLRVEHTKSNYRVVLDSDSSAAQEV